MYFKSGSIYTQKFENGKSLFHYKNHHRMVAEFSAATVECPLK